MNYELLLEIIELISNRLLSDPKFCGSTEGRRLNDLLWQLTGKSRNRTMVPSDRIPVVMTRTLTLPLDLDTRLTSVSESTGVARDILIAEGLAMLIAEDRLG